MTIADIMTAHPRTVRSASPLLEVKKIFEDMQFHHHLPVVDDGRLSGMISLYDYIIAIRGASLDDTDPVYSSRNAGEIMSNAVMSCAPGDDVHTVAAVFAENKVHALPVVLDGRLVGIVTTTDLMRYLATAR